MTANSHTKRTILIMVGILVVGFLLFRPYVIVPAGERVVVFSLHGGVIPTQLNEGFHFITPFIDHPEFYDARQQTYSISKSSWEGEVKGDDSIRCLTSDGQEVGVELSMRFHIDPDNVWRLHKEIGKDYISKIIRPELRSHTRIAIAEYPADRVYSAERVAIQTNLETRLREKLSHNYIQVDEVLLRSISFSDAYQNAIIQKQISQQNAQRMQYVLAKERQEKRRKIIMAEGEAESIRLKGQAIATNPRVVAYQYVQKIAPNIKTILSSGNVPLPTVGMEKP